MLRIASAVVVALAIAATAVTPADAGDPTPTPTAALALAAPTDLAFDGDATLTWTDNAVGETGYEVVVSIDDRQDAISLPPNSTMLVLPDFARVDCTMPPFQSSWRFDVYAVSNDLAGDAATLEVVFDCPQVFATPTPAATAQPAPPAAALPTTGVGAGNRTGAWSTVALVGLAATSILGAATLSRVMRNAGRDS